MAGGGRVERGGRMARRGRGGAGSNGSGITSSRQMGAGRCFNLHFSFNVYVLMLVIRSKRPYNMTKCIGVGKNVCLGKKVKQRTIR